jgi:hypothetical protein
MRWENLRHLFGVPDDPVVEDINEIEPRALNARELDLISSILHTNEDWKDVDLSRTTVVAEGHCGRNGTNFCTILKSPEPESLGAKSDRDGVGQLWINLDDGSVINAQLTQSEGRLQELYLIYVDPKDSHRKLPAEWHEVSREAVPM